MVIIVYFTMTGMIILDIVSKYRSFTKFQDGLKKQNKRKIFKHFPYIQKFELLKTFLLAIVATEDMHILTYFPFYFEYYVLMALHIQFAQTALGVQRRYYRLNLAIRNIFALSNNQICKCAHFFK